MKIGDKVKSSLSLWSNSIGEVFGIIESPRCPQGDWVHVVFPETDEHYAFQQSFNSFDLIIVNEKTNNI